MLVLLNKRLEEELKSRVGDLIPEFLHQLCDFWRNDGVAVALHGILLIIILVIAFGRVIIL
jgi:hypothetical protein